MPEGLPRCRVLPLPDEQVSFVRQSEFTRWHHATRYKGPFFHPLNGTHGISLTRMGHPGDPSHDHHRSIWFAHEKVSGVDFWSGRSPAFIRQQQWLAYASGDDEAIMAVRLGWYDGHDPQELMIQELVAAFIPQQAGDEGSSLELQATFTPTSETLELGQTSFGILGVRVAESISVHFGGGRLTGSDGKQGERDLFGEPNRWTDYSGPIAETDTGIATEGITLFDHPSNPNHPAKWHVRE
nr:PmoA family protein [Planctomycetota bacterium]